MKNITILGMGAMGLRMSENFLKKGYQVSVWNRTADKCNSLVKKGAQQFLTPKDAVENADIVISMLSNDDASKNVWLDKKIGALAGLAKNTVAIECSTVSPEWSIELSSEVEKVNAYYLEAPVIGSRPQAENSQLIHLVGGEESVLAQVHDALCVNASAIHHLGEIGKAMSMKLAVNGLFGIQVAALSEMLGLIKHIGIEKNAALTLLSKLPTTSPALVGVGLGIIADNYDPLFPIDLVEKDFSYLLQLAKQQASEIPITNTTLNIYQQAQHSGFGKGNISGVARLYL